MKGKPEVITMLNELLAEGHASAVNSATYSVMCKKWGYYDLEKYFSKRLHEQLESIGKILNRIIFLDGVPQLQNINEVPFVETIEEMFLATKKSQMNIISICTDGIELSVKSRDYGTRQILEYTLGESDLALAKVEAQITKSMR